MCFFFNDTATTEIYTLSLHDALPISILEVAGTAADHKDILEMEGRWQRTLQSREMGLNRNLAKASG